MSTTPELAVSLRNEHGTSASRRLRRAGRLPAIAYGRGEEPIALSVDALEVNNLLRRHGVGGLMMLKVEGATDDIPVIVKELQVNPRRNELSTLDFLRVSLTEQVSSVVPLVLEGEPAGVRHEGGLLVQSLHEIRIKALPQDLPENVVLDVTELELNGVRTVGDIKFPEGVESEEDPEEVVASVAVPRIEEEPEEELAEVAEGEEGAEDAGAAEETSEESGE